MRVSYGVVWREGEHPLAHGKLELLPRALRLDGMRGSTPVVRELPYDSLSEIRIGRAARDRIEGRPSLVVEPRTGDALAIASVVQAGVLAEIAERLAALQLGTKGPRRFAVVLPLRENDLDAVRTLLAVGPPFDPEALSLHRHEVFLTSSEAIFVFESSAGAHALESLLQDPALWQRASEWHAHLAGPPKIAEDVFFWSRNGAGRIDNALLPPGLRNGDSLDR